MVISESTILLDQISIKWKPIPISNIGLAGLAHQSKSNNYTSIGILNFFMPTSEDIFFTLFGILFFSMAISWIAFARISMARIEREIEKDSLCRPGSWDGIGARALWYAHAVVLPLGKWNRPDDPFFDVLTARRYAQPIDRKLGLALMISGYSFCVLGLMGSWVFDFY